jgi:hypothetical protein
MSRHRFQGEPAELQEVLGPFVRSAGWLHYAEKASDPIKPEVLVAHGAMLRACTQLCPNMAFTSSLVTEAFEQLADTKCFEVLGTPEARRDWIETITKRFRTACRHLSQSRLKRPRPRWVQLVDGMEDTSVGPGSEDAGASIADATGGAAGSGAGGSPAEDPTYAIKPHPSNRKALPLDLVVIISVLAMPRFGEAAGKDNYNTLATPACAHAHACRSQRLSQTKRHSNSLQHSGPMSAHASHCIARLCCAMCVGGFATYMCSYFKPFGLLDSLDSCYASTGGRVAQ